MVSIKKVFNVINFKTLYFNFKYLPFKQAVKLPVLISRQCRLMTAKGEVKIESPVRFGMIVIGCGSVGIFDNKKSRTVWHVAGTVVFEGKAHIGHGCKISVKKDAILRVGNNFRCTAESAFAVAKSVTIGSDSLFSWDILIMDTDWHKIVNEKGEIQNPSAPIVIGNRVWIGCRATILKGVNIPDGTVVAACSTVTKSIAKSNTIVGGDSTLRTIRDAVLWQP